MRKFGSTRCSDVCATSALSTAISSRHARWPGSCSRPSPLPRTRCQQHETTEIAGRGGEQDGAASTAAARAALRRQVGAIAQTARAAEAPGLGGTFRASLSCGDERLLSQARTFLKEAKPFAGTFVAHELPSNFLRQLQAAIDAFELARQERVSGRGQRVASAGGL